MNAFDQSTAPPANMRRRWLRRIAFAVLAGAVVYGATRAVVPHIAGVAHVAGDAPWSILALVGIGCVLYRLANAAVWGLVLSAVGRPIGAGDAARMWLLSEACRWLPGSIWSYGSRLGLGVRMGIPATTLGAALGLEFGLTVASWLVVGLVGALVSGLFLKLEVDVAIGLTVGCSIALALFAIVPAIRRRLENKIRGALGRLRQLGNFHLDRKRILKIFLAYVALNVFSGIVCWVLMLGLRPGQESLLFAVVAANAIAWLVGFFAIFAPAGLGVREGAFVLLLAPAIPLETCVAAASVLRMEQIAAELICLGLTSVPYWTKKRAEETLKSSLGRDKDVPPAEAPSIPVLETI